MDKEKIEKEIFALQELRNNLDAQRNEVTKKINVLEKNIAINIESKLKELGFEWYFDKYCRAINARYARCIKDAERKRSLKLTIYDNRVEEDVVEYFAPFGTSLEECIKYYLEVKDKWRVAKVPVKAYIRSLLFEDDYDDMFHREMEFSNCFGDADLIFDSVLVDELNG